MKGVLMVLDEDGKLLGWKWSDRIQPIETTALDFTRDLAAGRWIAGRSGTQMDQAQPGVRWVPQGQGRCDRPSRRRSAARAGGCRLGQATTNLFVIFDASGRIINVDISRDFV